MTMLFDECFGDRIQAQLLVIAYYQAKNKYKQSQMKKMISSVEHVQPVLLYNGSFKEVMNEVDDTFKAQMKTCYTTFNSITEPILSRRQIMTLVAIYKNRLPHHYKLMKEVLGFHLKENKTRNVHLHESSYYDRLLFYQFLQQSRIRNVKHMPFWGMVAAADAYAKGDGEKSIHTSVHSGYSTTISTFLSKTKQWRNDMPTLITSELSKINKFVCCLDNNQKGFPLKYQRNGSSNRFIKVTATCIKECITVSPLYDIISNPVKVTYFNQAVPSPLGMAKYEIVLNELHKIDDKDILKCIHFTHSTDCSDYDLNNNPDTIDIESLGKRIDAYQKICYVNQQLNNIRQCASGYVAKENKVYFVNHTPSSLKTDKVERIIKYFHSLKPTLLKAESIKSFQYKNTMMWNQHTKDVVKLIIPPVSLHDEIKTDGYGMALIELLVQVGLLDELIDVITGVKTWKACHNYDKKIVYLCLDGLSIDRHRCFYRKLLDLPLSFKDEFKQAVEFQKVIGRVVELSGPLHMSFHMLQCIYNLYGGLLGVSQKCVEWKKIKPAKVSDNYRLCCSLAMLVYEEITRLLLIQYMNTVADDTIKKDNNDGEGIGAISIAQGFLDYVNDRAERSSDKSIVYICRYWLLMNVFKLYYDSQKGGDFIMMEQLENDFCGVFLLLGKSKYYELCLGQMEKRYSDISVSQLNEIRINGSCRYRKDSKTQTYVMHVLDELMENVNCWTKWLPLGSDEKSWVEHSPNVMVARRCLNFVNNEYRRGLIDFESAVNFNEELKPQEQIYSKYIEPRCIRERSRLFELLQHLFHREIPGRSFKVKVAEEAIETLKTSLKKAKEPIVNTHIENTLVGINELIIQDNDGTDTIVNEDTPILEPVLNELVQEHTMDNEVLDDPTTSPNSESSNLSLVDVIKMGKVKMEDLDIATHRKNVRDMRKCHDNFLLGEYDKLVSNIGNIDSVKLAEIEALNPTRVSRFIINFNSLKLKKNTSSNFIIRFQGITNGL